MSDRSPSEDSTGGAPATRSSPLPPATDSLIVASFFGILGAAVALTTTLAGDLGLVVITGSTLLGFGGGALLGAGLVRFVPGLLAYLGGKKRRHLVIVLPAAPFAVVGFAAIFGPFGTELGFASVGSMSTLVILGYALRAVASTRYAETVTADRSLQTCRWQPPRSPRMDAVLLVIWLGLAVVYAVAGDWLSTLVWGTLGVLWLTTGLIEGRFQIDGLGTTPEIQIYETGFVKQRPLTSTFVSWKTVDHVRLRDDELVFDRGLFDTRLDRDALESPDELLAAIESQLSDRTATLPSS
ncbi:hypothetical protein C483_10006 [Natrialba hulunbeirensis JCM 10989]|uniref:PH domain-containing protein n=1 Tax=Natrialba hulunbeirensis JCM 10989 TaxID=1227493 RepID=L9ZXY2_9EURY|nr:hypothetical protein [Natrialba hulunbeirensis]ELY91365.1 hypothetical protein C483_10006 [Natrialba hulunbeirensis JCM 10989]